MTTPGQPPRPLYDSPDNLGSDAFYASIGRAFVAMCAFVPVLFGIEVIDVLTGQRLQAVGGIRPHRLAGLGGVLFAPFLHDNFAHVVDNSVPLIVLGTFVLAGGTRRFLIATGIIVLVSGLGTWLIGDPTTVVVGASGVVFGYLGALLARGVIERTWWSIVSGLLIASLYGWQIVALPSTPARVSWQAHIFGFLGGVLAAVLLRSRRPQPPDDGSAAPGSGGTQLPPDRTRDTLALPPGHA